MKNHYTHSNKLPPVAFCRMPTTGKPVMIRRGRPGYYVIVTRLSIEALNKAFGVNQAQADAMLVGSMFGWDCRAATPDFYTEHVGL